MKWETVKLGDITDYITDGDHQPAPKADEGIHFIKIKDIDGNTISFAAGMYVPNEYYDKLPKNRKPVKNDILYTVVGSYGIPAYVNTSEYFCFERNIALLHPNEKVLPRFLFYSLKNPTFYQMVDNIANGSAQKLIPLSKLSGLQIKLPPLPQQNIIVSILSAYDDLIENNQKQIKLLEEAAQRLYKEWFIDLRFPGHESTPIHDGLPEGWEKSCIDSHITLYSGFAFKSTAFSDEGQYKIVTIKNVKDAQFIGDNVSYIKEIPTQMPDHCKLSDGDILLSLTGNVGRVCLVFGEKYLLNQRVAKIYSSFPGFTYCLFRSKDIFDAMKNLANGAAQQNLSPVRTGKLEALFPRLEIAKQFEKIVVPMLQKIVLLNKEIVSAAHARDRLLPKLMSGEIEV